MALIERRFEEFAALRKVSLKAIFSVSAANSDSELQFGLNFMRRCFPKLSQQQKDVLLEWEGMLCEPADAERLAAQPALQRQLDRLVALLGAYLSCYLSVYSIYLSPFDLSIYLSISLFLYPSHLSIYLSIYLSMRT